MASRGHLIIVFLVLLALVWSILSTIPSLQKLQSAREPIPLDQWATVSSKANLLPSVHEQYRKCRIDLGHYLSPLQETWVEQGKPVLATAVPDAKSYKIIFIVQHMTVWAGLPKPKQRGLYLRYQKHVVWTCHGSGNRSVEAQVLEVDTNLKTITVVCPSGTVSVSYTLEANNTFSVAGPKEDGCHGDQCYDISRLVACEHESPLHDGPLIPRDISLMACTMIRDVPPHELALWIEYHRVILGFEHFLLYVHQNFSSAMETLPRLPYVKYVPWEYAISWSPSRRGVMELWDFFHQRAQQTECSYRAAQANVSWVANMDIDEYIYVLPKRGNQSEKQTLLELLHETGGRGLSLESQFFGAKERLTRDDPKPEWVLDYVWRHPETSGPKARTKLIVDPSHVRFLNVHFAALDRDEVVPADPSIIKLIHYKRPSNGVFISKQEGKKASREAKKMNLETPNRPFEPVYDDSFREAYKATLLERLGIP